MATAPPLFPEPIQVGQSVSQASYDARITFVKRTLYPFLLTLLASAILGKVVPPFLDLQSNLAAALTTLVTITLTRRFFVRGPLETAASATGLILCLALTTNLFCLADEAGLPVVLFTAQLLIMLVYTLLCGRDFSFVGFAAIPTLTTLAISGLTAVFGLTHPGHVIPGLALHALFGLYISYDLAMIMKRRRPQEQISAVADFYRDLLNIFTYPFRVFQHWQKYQFPLHH